LPATHDETDLKSRSRRALYYRNDLESMRNDHRRRLWLARNPVFGDFGRYSRIFGNIFGTGNYQRSPRRFNNDYYNGYADNYDYPSNSDYYYDDYYNYGPSRRPSAKKNMDGPKKNKKFVGVKLSNKFPSNDLNDDAMYGFNTTLSNGHASKLSSILNKIKFGNATSNTKESEKLNSNSLFRSKQKTNLNDLKKLRTSSHLIEMKFPKLDSLALKIASSMETSAPASSTSTSTSTSTKKTFLANALKTSTKNYFSSTPASTTTRSLRKASTVKTPSFKLANTTPANERKFIKVDKLASRIVSHFI